MSNAISQHEIIEFYDEIEALRTNYANGLLRYHDEDTTIELFALANTLKRDPVLQDEIMTCIKDLHPEIDVSCGPTYAIVIHALAWFTEKQLKNAKALAAIFEYWFAVGFTPNDARSDLEENSYDEILRKATKTHGTRKNTTKETPAGA